MITHSGFVCNQGSDVLRVRAGHNSMIEDVVIQIVCRVFEVKLNEFDPVRKSVNRNINALNDRNDLLVSSRSGLKNCKWFVLFI